MGRLDDKIIVVTGAARGLGETDARLLAHEGARLILTDIDEAAGTKVALEIGDRARFLRQDVSQESEWRMLIDVVLSEHGRLDGLVNNAGVVEAATPETTTEAQYRKIMAVSADGTFFGCKHAIGAMRQSGGGSIVNMASLAAIRGQWRYAAYCAAKGAVEALTRAVAVYCREHALNIRCNALHPSGFDTPMVRKAVSDARASAMPGANAVGNDLGDPLDVARAVLFLLSDESRFINGVSLSIDNAQAVA